MLSDRFFVRNRNLYEKILINLSNQVPKARPATCGSLRNTKDRLSQQQTFKRLIRRIAGSKSKRLNTATSVSLKQKRKIQAKPQTRTCQDSITENQTPSSKSDRLRLQSLAHCPQSSIGVGDSLEKSYSERHLKEFSTMGENEFLMNNFRADFTSFQDISNAFQQDVELAQRRKANKLKKYTRNKFVRVWDAHRLVKQSFQISSGKSIR